EADTDAGLPTLHQALRAAAESLAGDWGQKLAEITVELIEEPAFRLAGAEEAIRQLIATLEQTLQHHEPLARDLAEKAAGALARPRPLAAGAARPRAPGEGPELLRSFAKWRYQALVLEHLSAAFIGLRGHLSDELREVNFCRVRLAELER